MANIYKSMYTGEQIDHILNKAENMRIEANPIADATQILTKLAIGDVIYEITNSPLPIEISTEVEMTALLETAEIGSIYKYTGTTGTYENGTLYIVEESE